MLINVHDAAREKDIDYHPSMVQSMRGDLDKPPAAVPIDEAQLPDEEEEAAHGVACKPALPVCGYADDDATTCPGDSDRDVSDFDVDVDENGDDSHWNQEWDTHHMADWTRDFPAIVPAAPCADFDLFGDCRRHFSDTCARPLFAACLLRSEHDSASHAVRPLFACPTVQAMPVQDYWEFDGSKLVRHHVQPRTTLFRITRRTVLPSHVRRELVSSARRTRACYRDMPVSIEFSDCADDISSATRSLKSRWIGTMALPLLT